MNFDPLTIAFLAFSLAAGFLLTRFFLSHKPSILFLIFLLIFLAVLLGPMSLAGFSAAFLIRYFQARKAVEGKTKEKRKKNKK